MIKSTKLKAAARTMVSAIFAAVPRLANACATCGLSEGDHAFYAYRTSVLFLLASPYFLFAALGGITYYAYRRSQRQNHESNSPTTEKR